MRAPLSVIEPATAGGDAAYDALARHFEEHVDMDAIVAWFGDGEE